MKIDDIAKLAGVSKSAVSLAFNNKPGISEQTKEHILKTAAIHGYTPRTVKKRNDSPLKKNHIIRFVACKNTDVITDQYDSQPFFRELLNYLTDIVRENGYTLAISSINIHELESNLSQLEADQESAGILLLGTDLPLEKMEEVESIHPNIVVLDTLFEASNMSFVSINNFLGGFQAGEFLYKLGHRKIGFIKSNERIYNFSKREAGFLHSLDKNGLSLNGSYVFEVAPMQVLSQESLKKSIASLKSLPSAFFCENDYMAISTIKTLHELGIKVPEQVSVLGFDNIYEANIISPELTTVQVRKDVLAKTAVEKLVQSISSNNFGGTQTLVNTEIIQRNSCIAFSSSK
ncbi:LacI family DNA-binding transcriptional regulator [Niallia taxi]|uniref:LacI family DNA-binding transcriptional regulator n=1 Tax=Niallia taxi TaxID=2499688 RepID=UPI002E20E018|nr:LacI family DNA-binding transcriptional regulator [Niallia taxi]MED4120953.1 LacI family DNA-binding transcriptional regulator [Niallia taxi]